MGKRKGGSALRRERCARGLSKLVCHTSGPGQEGQETSVGGGESVIEGEALGEGVKANESTRTQTGLQCEF